MLKIDQFSRFDLVEVDEVNSLGVVDDYVYDIEVEGAHNFFANDILVHNSSFTALGLIARRLGVQDKDLIPFLHKLDEEGVQPYLNKFLDRYAKGMGCEGNILEMKVDDIADQLLIYAKNRYAMLSEGKDKSKGIPTISTSYSSFTRNILKSFLSWLLEEVKEGALDPLRLGEKVVELKNVYSLGGIEEVASLINVGDVSKGVTIKPSQKVVTFAPGTQPHVKGAGYYNLSIRSNSGLRGKYKLIKGDEPIRYYYTINEEYPIYAYPADALPMEVALAPDHEAMFRVQVLGFINDTIRLFGLPAIKEGLI